MITEAERENRRSRLGSSDIAALCDIDPYKSRFDLWMDKTGRLEDRPASDDCDRGTDLEPYVLDMFERRMGVKLQRNVELRNGGIFGANLDAAILKPSAIGALIGITGEMDKIMAIVEAKTTVDADAWGEGIEDVPDRVLVQVQMQIMLAECEIGYVPVLIPKYKKFAFSIYQLPRHEDLIEQIMHLGQWFWEKCVLADTPPPNSIPHLEALKRRRREPKSVVALNQDAAVLWELLQHQAEIRKTAEKQEEQLKASLICALEDSEVGELPGGGALTFLEQNGPRSCDWALLEIRLRECGQERIYKELVKQGRHRVLRFKKAAK